jgi:hypothetical protein
MTAQTEAQAVLSVDDKWSVEYDPLDNDRPMQVLRYGEPTAGRTTGWNNDAHAMFYALLARDAELAALKKQVEELTAEAKRLESRLKVADHTIEMLHGPLSVAALTARADAAEAEAVALRKALEFYADVSKYPAPLTGGMGDLWADCGRIARAALEAAGGRG